MSVLVAMSAPLRRAVDLLVPRILASTADDLLGFGIVARVDKVSSVSEGIQGSGSRQWGYQAVTHLGITELLALGLSRVLLGARDVA